MNLRKAALGVVSVGALAAATAVLPTAAAQAHTPVTPKIGSAASLPSPQLAARGATRVCAGVARDRCMAQIVTVAPGSTKALTTSTPAGYGAADFAAAYNLPGPTVGPANTIAILDEGAYPTLEADLGAYRAQYGLPACTAANGCFKQVNEHGGAPLAAGTTADQKAFDEEVGVETSLDVDMASAACPTCHILEITVNRDITSSEDQAAEDFGVAMDTAASLGASAASVSYQFDPDATLDLGTAARDFYHPGMAITASSGDGGFEGTPSGWPQNLPTVTSVGGTSLFRSPGAGHNGYTETAWDGSGSGCAAELPPALGQPSDIAAVCAGHRADSDVSADADPTTGAAIYDTYAPSSGEPYGWIVVGGTSESSPFIAGVYARGGNLADVEGPNTLYADPSSAFNDVAIGQNAPTNSGCAVLCTTGTGWDGPTGLGSPNGLAGF
ncbi:S8 family serine peptidase [Streptacidiphilus sp. PB12-B1b]|uniref:S8 family serine peptidase n=1 Tax=Streptacidiphilus sp. PB12-B1b TaxID=2705012 RepID=UPI0015FD47D2|nr:S8 family serine peptidase [Streptacidiphilus sp. PB12-B1b]QMU77389.1 S8 family serine peptidase [Streptacidiphilus sp. PB12-B1b]